MNDDRVVVILDGQRTVADFFLPYALRDESVEAKFDSMTSTLEISCPIDWRQLQKPNK